MTNNDLGTIQGMVLRSFCLRPGNQFWLRFTRYHISPSASAVMRASLHLSGVEAFSFDNFDMEKAAVDSVDVQQIGLHKKIELSFPNSRFTTRVERYTLVPF